MCNCLDSDRTDAYIHCLLPRTVDSDLPSFNDVEVSVEIYNGFTFNNDCGYLGVGRVGVDTICIRKTGRLRQAVVSSLCTMEDRAVDIF